MIEKALADKIAFLLRLPNASSVAELVMSTWLKTVIWHVNIACPFRVDGAIDSERG